MPSSVSRRKVLHYGGSFLLFGLAGCETSPREGSPTTTAATPPSDYRFSFTSTMVKQASESHPPQFRVSLANEGEQTVEVGYGQSLMFTAGSTHRPAGLIIVPAADESNKQPTTPVDGCWQYEEGQEVTVYAVLRGETLAPGDRATATFAVYNEATADSCYPPGEYTFQDEVRLDTDGREMTLTVLITIDESGTLSVKPKESDLPE